MNRTTASRIVTTSAYVQVRMCIRRYIPRKHWFPPLHSSEPLRVPQSRCPQHEPTLQPLRQSAELIGPMRCCPHPLLLQLMTLLHWLQLQLLMAPGLHCYYRCCWRFRRECRIHPFSARCVPDNARVDPAPHKRNQPKLIRRGAEVPVAHYLLREERNRLFADAEAVLSQINNSLGR